MKVLLRLVAVLTTALLSVFAVQRLVKKLYSGMGKKYVVIEEREGA